MATKTVFYSVHYQRDVHRVQLVRNINALEGQPLLNAQGWEAVKRRGQQAIVDWIDKEMLYKRALVAGERDRHMERQPAWRGLARQPVTLRRRGVGRSSRRA